MKMIAGYELIRRIGYGSTADVWLARDSRSERKVAVKLFRGREGALSDADLARFEKEATINARLDHANIPRLLGHGSVHGRPYIAVEYVKGPSLRDIVDRVGAQLPIAFVLEVGRGVAAALGHAHSLSDDMGRPLPVTHRDVKPANIIIGSDSAVRLLDFGLARWAGSSHQTTHAHSLKGTPLYMSPEQVARPTEVGPSSDIFSLGAMLIELLTGRSPYLAGSHALVLRKIICYEPEPELEAVAEVDPMVAELLRMMVIKDPRFRMNDASTVSKFLGNFAERHPLDLPLYEAAVRMLEGSDATRSAAAVDISHYARLRTVTAEPDQDPVTAR